MKSKKSYVKIMPGKIVRRRRYRKRVAPSTVKAVKTIVSREFSKRAEKKYFLYQHAASSVADGMTFTATLSAPAQGATDTTRNGDSIYMRSIKVQGNFKIHASATATAVRVIIFQWFPDDNVDTVSGTAILSSGYANTVNACNAPLHHDQRRKYHIMYDRRISLDSAKEVVQWSTPYMRPKVRKLNFNAGATSGSNKLYILAVSDEPTYEPTISYVSKMTYNDM